MERTHFPILMLTIGLLLAGCGDRAAGGEDPGPGSQPTPTADTIVDWNDPNDVAHFEGGWTVGACEGEAPLLCVVRSGETVGLVEAMTYDVDSFDNLDPAATPDANLLAFADGFFEALATDRADGCGADYGFQPFEPASFRLGGVQGITYGFAGTMADGSSSELNLQYATIVGDRVLLITAIAYDEGGCPGPNGDLAGFDSETLAAFRPHLEKVLADSPLPQLS